MSLCSENSPLRFDVKALRHESPPAVESRSEWRLITGERKGWR